MSIPVVWVMGCPGTDKATVSKLICDKYGFLQLDPQTIMLSEIQANTAKGKQYDSIRKQGNEVPLAEIMPVLEKILMGQKNLKGYVIDGYPHNISEANLLEKQIGPPDIIFNLEIEESSGTAQARVLNAYKNGANKVLSRYESKTMRLNANRDPKEVFEDIVPNMDLLVKNRGTRITIGR